MLRVDVKKSPPTNNRADDLLRRINFVAQVYFRCCFSTSYPSSQLFAKLIFN